MEQNNKLRCELCNVNFCKPKDYDRHTDTIKHRNNVLGIDKLKCNYCDYETAGQNALDVHFRNFHKVEYKQLKDSKIEYIKHCEFCDITFNQSRDSIKHFSSKKHLDKIFNVDKSQCLFCNYKTSKASTLTRHIKEVHPEHYKEIKITTEDLQKFKAPEAIQKTYKKYANALYTIKKYITGDRCAIRRLKDRFFKEDSKEIIEHELKIEDNIKRRKELEIKIKELTDKYSDLDKIHIGLTVIKNDDPTLIIYDKSVVLSDNDDDDMDDEEKQKQRENRKFEKDTIKKQKELKIKKEKEDEYNIEIEKLQSEFQNTGDASIFKKIEKIEKKINELYE